MFNMYVVAPMTGSRDEITWVRNSILMQDWFNTEIAALAAMDQYNGEALEKLSKEQYENGDFFLNGVYKFEFAGVV